MAAAVGAAWRKHLEAGFVGTEERTAVHPSILQGRLCMPEPSVRANQQPAAVNTSGTTATANSRAGAIRATPGMRAPLRKIAQKRETSTAAKPHRCRSPRNQTK